MKTLNLNQSFWRRRFGFNLLLKPTVFEFGLPLFNIKDPFNFLHHVKRDIFMSEEIAEGYRTSYYDIRDMEHFVKKINVSANKPYIHKTAASILSQ